MEKNIGDRLNEAIRCEEKFNVLLTSKTGEEAREVNGTRTMRFANAAGNRVLQIIMNIDGSSINVSDTDKETGITISRIIYADPSGITPETLQYYPISVTSIVSTYSTHDGENFISSTTMQESLEYSRDMGKLVSMKSTPDTTVVNFLETDADKTTKSTNLDTKKTREISALLRLPGVIKDPQDIIRFIKDSIENFFADIKAQTNSDIIDKAV